MGLTIIRELPGIITLLIDLIHSSSNPKGGPSNVDAVCGAVPLIEGETLDDVPPPTNLVAPSPG